MGFSKLKKKGYFETMDEKSFRKQVSDLAYESAEKTSQLVDDYARHFDGISEACSGFLEQVKRCPEGYYEEIDAMREHAKEVLFMLSYMRPGLAGLKKSCSKLTERLEEKGE